MAQRFCIMVLLLLCMTAAAAAADVIERRGAEPVLTGAVTMIDGNGVKLRSESGAVHTVPWDRVRNVRAAITDPTLPQRLETAERLWRARSRLERGDASLAEPLFERLFEQYQGKTHETALVVAEGLLRCRLARLDHSRAVVAALEVMRLRRAGVQTVSYASLPSVLDEQYELCTALAPAWVHHRGVAALERALGSYDSGDDRVVAAVAVEYRRAALRQLGRAVEPDDPTLARDSEPEHDGVELLRLMVDAGEPGRVGRDARHALQQRLDALPGWARGWAHYTIGSAELGEDDIDARLRGLVHLLHLPAGGPDAQLEYLTGLALDEAADGLEAIGRADAARTLRLELAQKHPGHPVLEPDRLNTSTDV